MKALCSISHRPAPEGQAPHLGGKLALFLPSLRGGGAEIVMVTLANGFAARGFTVDLVLAHAEGVYFDKLAPAVRVENLHAARVAWALPGLLAYLKRERPIALLSALNHANVVAYLAHRLARVPTRLLISEHNTLSAARPQNIRGRLVPLFMRWSYPFAHSVVAVSHGASDDLARTLGLAPNRVKAIYNPVVNDDLLAKAQEPLDHPWFTNDAPPVILGAGRLTDQKDFVTLIRAFAQVRTQRPARLLILGEGELRAELEALVRSLGLEADVMLPGFVANPFAYMGRAALFVLSSRWEGFGNVLVEAMACGTQVVSTDCLSGPAEILENGKWGRLVPVGDVAALAGAMAAALDDSNPPEVAARACEFNVDRAVDAYLELMMPKKPVAGKVT